MRKRGTLEIEAEIESLKLDGERMKLDRERMKQDRERMRLENEKLDEIILQTRNEIERLSELESKLDGLFSKYNTNLGTATKLQK